MKGVEEFEISKEKAEKAWKEHLNFLKTREDEGIRVLKQAYYHAKEGRKIIDIYDTMEKAGLNKEDWPKLAICRADGKECYFQRRVDGGGLFHHESLRGWGNGNRNSVRLRAGTFRNVPLVNNRRWDNGNIRYALVPSVPAEHYPNGLLERYYILWEVEEWHDKSMYLQPPIDPFLLKRLSPNIFAVLAEWELTKLERAVIRGALDL